MEKTFSPFPNLGAHSGEMRLLRSFAPLVLIGLVLTIPGGRIWAQVKAGGGVEVIKGGDEVDVKKHLAAGKITLIEFYADWCGPCKMISPALEELAKTDPDIALCKIDIVNWQSAVSRQYGIHSIPCVVVFDRKGEIVGVMRGVDPDALKGYISQAKRT